MIASMASIFHLFIHLLCAPLGLCECDFSRSCCQGTDGLYSYHLIGYDTVPLFLGLTYASKRDGLLLTSTLKLMSMHEMEAILVRILNSFSCSISHGNTALVVSDVQNRVGGDVDIHMPESVYVGNGVTGAHGTPTPWRGRNHTVGLDRGGPARGFIRRVTRRYGRRRKRAAIAEG